MRNTISAIIALVVFLTTSSCKRIERRMGNGNSHTFLISKSEYPVDAIQQVSATTSGGNIEIVGDATTQATLEIFGSYRSSDSIEVINKIKEIFDLNISHDNNALTVIAKQKSTVKTGFLSSNNSGVAVHYVIHVRKEVASTLKTSGGNISLFQLTGTQNVNTSGGNIEVSDLNGNIDGSTSGGNINIHNTKGETVHMETSGGNIDAENIEGKTTTLETSGGNVSLKKGTGSFKLETSGGNVAAHDVTGPITMSTSGGNVEAINIDGSVDGSTSGGHIEAKFVRVTGDISLDNSGGSINISIPKDTKAHLAISSESVHANGLVNFSGKSEKDAINGDLNGGGPTIKAESNGGDVHLNVE